MTPLNYAYLYNHLQIVEYLISKGVIINAKNQDERTSLPHTSFLGKIRNNIMRFIIILYHKKQIFDSNKNIQENIKNII